MQAHIHIRPDTSVNTELDDLFIFYLSRKNTEVQDRQRKLR